MRDLRNGLRLAECVPLKLCHGPELGLRQGLGIADEHQGSASRGSLPVFTGDETGGWALSEAFASPHSLFVDFGI